MIRQPVKKCFGIPSELANNPIVVAVRRIRIPMIPSNTNATMRMLVNTIPIVVL